MIIWVKFNSWHINKFNKKMRKNKPEKPEKDKLKLCSYDES